MGVVSLVLESLVDSTLEKRVSEAALVAFNRLCGCELGRKKAYENALTVPVLVKSQGKLKGKSSSRNFTAAKQISMFSSPLRA